MKIQNVSANDTLVELSISKEEFINQFKERISSKRKGIIESMYDDQEYFIGNITMNGFVIEKKYLETPYNRCRVVANGRLTQIHKKLSIHTQLKVKSGLGANENPAMAVFIVIMMMISIFGIILTLLISIFKPIFLLLSLIVFAAFYAERNIAEKKSIIKMKRDLEKEFELIELRTKCKDSCY